MINLPFQTNWLVQVKNKTTHYTYNQTIAMPWQMRLDFKMANAWANESRFQNRKCLQIEYTKDLISKW